MFPINSIYGLPTPKLVSIHLLTNPRTQNDSAVDNPAQLSGSQDGHLHVWSVKTGNKIAVLEGNHPNPIGCVAFNPKYMMVASSCNNAVSSISILPLFFEIHDSDSLLADGNDNWGHK